jgi:RNA polymerase sigma-70 factor (ECF subfamily)
MKTGDTSLGGQQRQFPSTLWGLISQVGRGDPGLRRAALEEFSRRYWKPVYYYVRLAWAKSNDDAKDLTQAFFLWLMEKNPIERLSREGGSFRNYLKTLVKRFVQHDREAAGRLKRGGGARLIPIDGEALGVQAADTPEAAYDKAWRQVLVDRAVGRVRARLQSGPKAVKFRAFEEYDLVAPERRPTYKDLAARLKVKETDVLNYLFSVREAIRSEIRAELAELAEDPRDLEAEWNALFGP